MFKKQNNYAFIDSQNLNLSIRECGWSFEKAVIVSGDGDFYCLVKQLIKDNKLLKIGIPNKKRYSALLRRYSQYAFYISLLEDRLGQ